MDDITHCGDWLPIDTAPQDGRKISIWTHRNEYVPWAFWSAEAGMWRSEFIQWEGLPTHWMPMPGKPKCALQVSIAPHYVQLMIASLVRIRDKTGKGSDQDFDRDSNIARLWSDSDHEIYELSNRALPSGILPFEDDRFPRLPDKGANDA